MNEQIGVVDEETRMKTKVDLFRDIVEKNLDDVVKPELTATSKIKVERYKGGFVVFYIQDLETGDVYFTIEEPFSEIAFEFHTEGEDRIRRSINSGSEINNPPDGVDLLDVSTLVSTRLLTEDEIDDLILFAVNPKSISEEGPPRSLVNVDPQEDALLMGCELPTWNLPHSVV